MLALKDELELRTETYTTALDKEDRFWERLIELKLSNVETAAHRRSHQQVQGELRPYHTMHCFTRIFYFSRVFLAFFLAFWIPTFWYANRE